MTEYVSRSEWGAKPPTNPFTGKPTTYAPIGAVLGVALHYEGINTGTYDHSLCDDKIRSIQAFHQNTREWIDIAYTDEVCQHGYVYEGRGPGHRTAAQGTNDGNLHYYAVCYLGGPNDPLTEAAKQAIVDVCNRLSPGGSRRPHSSFHSTACPGPAVSAWINAGMPVAHPEPTPEPTPIPVLEEDEMFLLITNKAGSQYLISSGGLVAAVNDQASSTALKAAGVKLAPLDDDTFGAVVNGQKDVRTGAA